MSSATKCDWCGNLIDGDYQTIIKWQNGVQLKSQDICDNCFPSQTVNDKQASLRSIKSIEGVI